MPRMYLIYSKIWSDLVGFNNLVVSFKSAKAFLLKILKLLSIKNEVNFIINNIIYISEASNSNQKHVNEDNRDTNVY